MELTVAQRDALVRSEAWDNTKARLMFVLQTVVDVPESVAAPQFQVYTASKHFMESLVGAKANALLAMESPRAEVIADGKRWMDHVVLALLPADDTTPFWAGRIRSGVHKLLSMGCGMKPRILSRLAAVKMDRQKLCQGDCEFATRCVREEPRLLRYFLGLSECDAWPEGDAALNSDEGALVTLANRHGGESARLKSRWGAFWGLHELDA